MLLLRRSHASLRTIRISDSLRVRPVNARHADLRAAVALLELALGLELGGAVLRGLVALRLRQREALVERAEGGDE